MSADDDRFLWFYRSCPAMIASTDTTGRYVDFSDAYLKRLGHPREELVGRRPQEYMTPESTRRMDEDYLPLLTQSGSLDNVPVQLLAKLGEVVELLMSAITERDRQGAFVQSIAVFTEQRESGRVERHYRDVYRRAPTMFHTTSLDGRIEAVSDYWLEKMGYEREEVIGTPAMSFLTEASQKDAETCIPRTFETGFIGDERLDFVRKDGQVLESLLSASADRDENGVLLRMLAVVHDITERNRAEAEREAAHQEIERLHAELKRERDYLREEVKVARQFGRIVGSSAAIERVLKRVELVAPTDANVMIFGESGTGKELIANAIHERSDRNNAPIIRVNCGAIPRELFESEFFGHLKGSFTGAVKDRVGRFELADGGTLFLDEVGEIPLDLQSKLLRVLQEGEFERIGGERTRKVDVRVIAATNRDLKAAIQVGGFREDLYFRLNVVPVEVPPLRARPEDIAQLAAHFVESISTQLQRSAPKLSDANLVQLQRYGWPGNIRELQNVIERAVILAQSGSLQFDLPETRIPHISPSGHSPSTEGPILEEAVRKQRDRDAIIAALEQADGKVSGRGGAAEILGLKPTTLASRIKALGIDKSVGR